MPSGAGLIFRTSPKVTKMSEPLYAHLLNEQGRPTKAILPPRNTRSIATTAKLDHDGLPLVFSSQELALRSVFAVLAPFSKNGAVEVLLHNGGLETQYISHGDHIAQLTYISEARP
jgi:hypothetical protein